jgi:hypothetical protein
LPPGKTGITLQLTLKPKAGYAAHCHEDGTITAVEDDVLVEMPLAGPSGLNDYGNKSRCYFFNFLTGEVDCTFTGGGAFQSFLTVMIRCWRGGGPPKQGQFYFAFAIGGSGLRYGYRENGEWFFNPEQLVGLTSLGGEAWFDPVVEGGNCSISSQAVLRWPQDFPNASFACDDLGICAEARFDLF